MISVPRLDRLDVEGYGLYPGVPDKAGESTGLHAEFGDGLSLIIGANGLGKTTLIKLIYRMIGGPYDIPSLAAGEELGNRRLEATQLPPYERTMFAARVADRAASATATLSLVFGDKHFIVTRNLSNLSLAAVSVNSGERQAIGEDAYQTMICDAAGVGSFGDLLLMLRYLVFYFEDRRALVWDQTAQRQLLRMLFLPPAQAQEWTAHERVILTKDSDVRNFQAVVGKEERELTKNVRKSQSATALRAELGSLEGVQENDRQRLQDISAFTADLDNARQQARAAHLEAQQDRESRFRALEEAKLLAIQARFPEVASTGRYILAQLMTDHECLVCGTHNDAAAAAYAERIEKDLCVVCSTPLATVEGIVEQRTVADERVSKRVRALEAADKTLLGATAARHAAESEFDAHWRAVARLEADIAERASRINAIVDALPPSELAMREQRDDLSRLRGLLEARKGELADLRRAFAAFVAERRDDLMQQAGNISTYFGEYASGFLSEQISLTWSSYRARLGQTGDLIEFPAFDLEMSGSDFGASVRRTGPNDVSESQREFIDLAFRMAMMRAASADGSASLVIDTPESSLDAVFAKRAGDILIRFADGEGNSLIITSNLVEGSLIPTLADGLKRYPEPRQRLVDLFALARPTAAVLAEPQAYADVRLKLLGPELS